MKIIVQRNKIDGYKFLVYLMDDNNNALEAICAHNAVDLITEINKLRLRYDLSSITNIN